MSSKTPLPHSRSKPASTSTSTSTSGPSSGSGTSSSTLNANAKTTRRGYDPYTSIKACCNMPPPPPPMVYRPDLGCYEKVKGPFKNPIPTRQQRVYDKFREKCCPPRPICMPKTYCCDDIRELNVCKAELQRLREERWREQERKAILEEKRRQEWMEQQYKEQVRAWEKAQAKCQRDRERRKMLLRQILCHRKEMKQLKEEARLWRCHKENLMIQQQEDQEDIWVNEFCQREDERRWEQEKQNIHQKNRFLDAQMQPRDTECMTVPELEELRRMFAPLEQGPKETFEYFVLEPGPTEEQMRKQAEQKMQCLMGLRNEHGIHLNLSGGTQKRTSIQLAMGPKFSSGERKQSCKVITTPGAICSNCVDAPNVQIPECLKPLMQTLSYRVNEIDTPLLSMKTFVCGKENEGGSNNGKEVSLESGPNFNGARLYGTIVLPKGKALSSFYTQPYNVSF